MQTPQKFLKVALNALKINQLSAKDVKKHLREVSENSLPGTVAHRLMASSYRTTNPESLPANYKDAAVLLVLSVVEGEWHLLFIRRNTYRGVHSGQMAFPGGKKESTDESLKATALRETHEEVGLVFKDTDIIANLSPLYIPPSNMNMSPFVVVTEALAAITPDPREVAAVHNIALSSLLAEANLTSYTFQKEGLRFTSPAIKFEEQHIWGASAMVFSELVALLAAIAPD